MKVTMHTWNIDVRPKHVRFKRSPPKKEPMEVVTLVNRVKPTTLVKIVEQATKNVLNSFFDNAYISSNKSSYSDDVLV